MVDRRRAIPALVALLAVAAVLAWRLGAPSPEAQVEARLRALCDAVGKAPGETAVQAAARALSIASCFANPIEIAGEAGPFAGRHTPRELAAAIARFRAASGALDLSFTDLTVEIRPPEEATARFTARLRGGADGPDDAYREVSARLRRAEGLWLFSRFDIVRVMEKP